MLRGINLRSKLILLGEGMYETEEEKASGQAG